MKKILFLLPSILLILLPQLANAETMTNGYYRVQMGNLDSISGESTGSNYDLHITSGENSPGLYEGTNYKVKMGFQYVPRTIPFSFSISNTLIDFGNLSPTNPVTRTTTLTVKNTDAKSFKVTAAENHPLTISSTGATIPDTTCDDGKCTQDKSSKWINTLTYGFGYRCDSSTPTSCVVNDKSFSDKTYFKQFSDSSHSESATNIMSGATGKALKATIMYKVNISSSQPAGVYGNSVTYLATPSY